MAGVTEGCCVGREGRARAAAGGPVALRSSRSSAGHTEAGIVVKVHLDIITTTEHYIIRIFWACHGPALMGRPMIFSTDGPRLDPADQFIRGWAAARPSPSYLQKFAARPGLAH